MFRPCRLSSRRTLTALVLAPLLAFAGGAAHAVAGDPGQFEAIRQADMRLAAVGWRLAFANAALCDRLEPGTGMQLHTLDQFDRETREAARTHFGFETPVAVEGVVPGSPADLAGVKPDDSLVRVGAIDTASATAKPGTTDRLVATQLAIAGLPTTQPIALSLLRKGRPLILTIQPAPVCRSRFELRLADDYRASADGTMVQISSRFFETYPEDQVAAVLAHELSHNILRHRARLEARGVSFGLLSGFGANVKYFRQTEIQADLLSLYLLTNAGYSPGVAPAFWKRFGPRRVASFLNSRSHPHWKDRVATMEREIGRIQALPSRPIVPLIVHDRDRPLSGDWQSLLHRGG